MQMRVGAEPSFDRLNIMSVGEVMSRRERWEPATVLEPRARARVEVLQKRAFLRLCASESLRNLVQMRYSSVNLK
jgi:hypothetical protein